MKGMQPFYHHSSRYKNFTVQRVTDLAELKATLVELVHEPTGAAVMHLETEDEENLFCLSFRTWPQSSNGVAHILEHTVLCGSKRFPVRDPFFSMSRRSLNTFMNALTGADFTCYPAASQVKKDFYNLLDVYLDAVFHPILDPRSFLQEGHRLEFAQPDNPDSPLMIKGIVYNEMKGALANPDSRLVEYLMESLFPHLTYGINSGGDPKDIPDLTYEQLKEFHETYYHPSRCLFFFYGDLPLEKHLDFIEEKALKGVKKLPPLPLLPSQPRFTKKVYREEFYPVSESEEIENKTLVGMAWLTCSVRNQLELLALSVIDLVLMGTDAAPLKMALLKSGLCKQTDATLEAELSEVPYILFCKGCPEKSHEGLEKLIRETLIELVEGGLPAHLVEGAIHQLELSRYEITGNSSPYGLSLFFRSALLSQHGGKPQEGLLIHTLFKELRELVKNPGYLPSLIRKYFLENPHFVCISLHPDRYLGAQETEAEAEKLRLLSASLTADTKKKIVEQAKELMHYQEEKEEEDEDILPEVTLKDVPPGGKEFQLIEKNCAPWTLFYHPCFTNDIVYCDLVFDLPDISEEMLPTLRLFSLLLPQIGCGGRNYKDHLDYVLQHTGGIGVSLDLSQNIDHPDITNPFLSIRGKALYRKADKLFSLFKDLIVSADFTDQERIQELLMQHFHGVKIASNIAVYVMPLI